MHIAGHPAVWDMRCALGSGSMFGLGRNRGVRDHVAHRLDVSFVKANRLEELSSRTSLSSRHLLFLATRAIAIRVTRHVPRSCVIVLRPLFEIYHSMSNRQLYANSRNNSYHSTPCFCLISAYISACAAMLAWSSSAPQHCL